MTQTYKYLHFVTLRSLVNWSVAYLIKNNTLSSNFPMVSIGTFLTRNKTAVDVKNNVIYKRVTIKTNGGGVCLRDQKSGKDIGTKKQFVVKEGQFIVSKIDARNGAFGVVPPEANNAIITGNFWTFDVNTKIILPQYLALFTATKEFMLFAEKASNGTTNRHYLQEPLFLSQQIPLPSLEEQNKIVAAYNATIAQADNLSQQAGDINDQIETYLKETLGTNIETIFNKSLLSFVHYKDISRWDPLFLLSSSNIVSKYSLVRLADCIGHFLTDQNRKSLRLETRKTPLKDFRYIGMEHVEKGSGQIIDSPIVKGKEIKSQTIHVPQGYYIYGKLRPYLNKYWYNDLKTDEKEIICSSEFFVFDIKDGINTLYFKCVLASYIVQQQIADAMSGARMPRISEQTFINIQIPLPPLAIQNEIVEHISALRAEQKNLQQQTSNLRTQAQQQFEQTIFE